MSSPVPLLLIALALAGLGLNLAAGGAPQPDWALALLVAALLARRQAWPWVLPALLVHDYVLYWSPWGAFPAACLYPWAVARLDAQIGAGLPQRLALMAWLTVPMIWHGWSAASWLLTLACCIPVWHALVEALGRRRVRIHA